MLGYQNLDVAVQSVIGCKKMVYQSFLILDLATNVHMKPLVQVFKNMEQSQLAHTVV